MDLFSASAQHEREARAPLAVRMRPRTLQEFVGQSSIARRGSFLHRILQGQVPTSLILYGPPGTGKTTLAHIIAGATESHFEAINAVTSGVADIRRVIQE